MTLIELRFKYKFKIYKIHKTIFQAIPLTQKIVNWYIIFLGVINYFFVKKFYIPISYMEFMSNKEMQHKQNIIEFNKEF